ncbi:MAG: BBE domain-containing protein, partial [Chloroflexota bacterium]
VGGLTLGGGYGYLARRHGLACDNVVSAEVVTAGGDVLMASEAENSDLLWGLRGGGGNFGIVTSFEFQLHPALPTAATGDLFFDLTDGPAVIRAVSDLADEMPDEMLLDAAVTEVRAEWEMPDLEVGRPIVLASWVFLGDPEVGRRAAAPLYAAAKPILDSAEALPYPKLQRLADASQRDGMRRYWKGGFVWELTDEAIETFLDRRGTSDGPVQWGGEMFSLGGAIARVGEDETAFSGRTSRFDFLTLASWEDAAEDEARLAGARAYWDRMARHLRGPAYVNSLEDEGTDRVRQAYGPAKYERLVALKRKYDPQNAFHLNQNIRP